MSQLSAHRLRWSLAAGVTALLTACAAGPGPQPVPPQPQPPTPAPGPGTPGTPDSGDTPETAQPIGPFASSGHAQMDAWRDDFASRALAQGRDRAVIRSLLEGISPLETFLGSTFRAQSSGIEDQAEFAKPIWEYVQSTVTRTRKRIGAEKLAANRALFDSLEAEYGVDREVLAAIWGMETSFGGFIGSNDAANTLANMAVEGRRRRFAEGELIALMKILENGLAERDDLVSGWAGAMGQTQFMPTTFLAHARDFTGDGRIDVWNSEADALASAANYLSVSGYRTGQPWGIEVTLPEGFDYSLADGEERRLSTWRTAGLEPAAGGPLEAGSADFAELWVPAGHRGPKFLLFKNFNVFKTYNRADSYALAVGLLSEGVQGLDRPLTPWPTDIRPLSVSQVKQLQAALNDLGYSAGPVDGIPGRMTKGALREFQARRGLIADGFPTAQMLSLVLEAAGS